MKKTLLAIITTSILGGFATLSAYADQSNCDPESVHCAYLTGLDQSNLKDGRYIKMTVHSKDGQRTGIECFNNSSTVEVLASDAAQAVGNNAFEVSICKDKDGTNCQPIGTDSFAITQTGGSYTATPATFNINLSAVAAQFPQCDATVTN